MIFDPYVYLAALERRFPDAQAHAMWTWLLVKLPMWRCSKCGEREGREVFVGDTGLVLRCGRCAPLIEWNERRRCPTCACDHEEVPGSGNWVFCRECGDLFLMVRDGFVTAVADLEVKLYPVIEAQVIELRKRFQPGVSA